jgi:hypothetical protein
VGTFLIELESTIPRRELKKKKFLPWQFAAWFFLKSKTNIVACEVVPRLGTYQRILKDLRKKGSIFSS